MKLQLKRIRKESRVSQEELARLLGVSSRAVGAWERGENVPNAEQVWNCAKILNTTPSELMGWYIDHPDDRETPGLGEIVSSYDSLSDEGREVAVNVVGALATSYPRPSPENLGGGASMPSPNAPA